MFQERFWNVNSKFKNAEHFLPSWSIYNEMILVVVVDKLKKIILLMLFDSFWSLKHYFISTVFPNFLL